MQPPFLLPEGRCIDLFFLEISSFLCSRLMALCGTLLLLLVFPISSSLSKFSAHILTLEPVLSCFAPIQTERFSHPMTL